jgi:hypothetical protein
MLSRSGLRYALAASVLRTFSPRLNYRTPRAALWRRDGRLSCSTCSSSNVRLRYRQAVGVDVEVGRAHGANHRNVRAIRRTNRERATRDRCPDRHRRRSRGRGSRQWRTVGRVGSGPPRHRGTAPAEPGGLGCRWASRLHLPKPVGVGIEIHHDQDDRRPAAARAGGRRLPFLAVPSVFGRAADGRTSGGAACGAFLFLP